MNETVTHIESLRCSVALDGIDSHDIIAAGTVRIAADADEVRITVPVGLGALTESITITLPIDAIADITRGPAS